MQTGSPYKLVMLASFPGGPAEERRLHAIFRIKRVHGEWFNRTGKLAVWVDRLRALQRRGPIEAAVAMMAAESPNAEPFGTHDMRCDLASCTNRIRLATAVRGQGDGVFCSSACATKWPTNPAQASPQMVAIRIKRRAERAEAWAAWVSAPPQA